jgi:thioredoxin
MNKTLMTILAGFFFAVSATACSNANSEGLETSSAGQTTGTNAGGDLKGETAKPEYLTVETFKAKIWDYEKNPQEWVYEGTEPAIIDFYADWCKPCKMVAPILEEISKDYTGKVKVYKIDTEDEKELAAVFQVSSIPTFLYIPANGRPQLDRGFKDKAAFERIISEVLLVE